MKTFRGDELALIRVASGAASADARLRVLTQLNRVADAAAFMRNREFVASRRTLFDPGQARPAGRRRRVPGARSAA
jgi:hypothetical protein